MTDYKPMRVIAGYIKISDQLYREALEDERRRRDIESGKVDWNPDDVDWDAFERMHEDA